MGKNLAWNIESRGYSVSVYNRSRQKLMKWLKNRLEEIYPTYSLEEFVESLENLVDFINGKKLDLQQMPL